MMGAGYWLNPATNIYKQVTTHDDWIKNHANASEIGLPDDAWEQINRLPYSAVDEIRILAVEGGLVRIRDHRAYISVQFHVDQGRVRDVLWSVLTALEELGADRFKPIKIDNFKTHDGVTLDWTALKSRLENNEVIVGE